MFENIRGNVRRDMRRHSLDGLSLHFWKRNWRNEGKNVIIGRSQHSLSFGSHFWNRRCKNWIKGSGKVSASTKATAYLKWVTTPKRLRFEIWRLLESRKCPAWRPMVARATRNHLPSATWENKDGANIYNFRSSNNDNKQAIEKSWQSILSLVTCHWLINWLIFFSLLFQPCFFSVTSVSHFSRYFIHSCHPRKVECYQKSHISTRWICFLRL